VKTLLVTFGDSWTFGSELDKPQEQNWTYYVGKHLGTDTLNLSCPASGIGHLVVQLFEFMKQDQDTDTKKIFMVGLSGTTRYLSYSNSRKEFINITPEANYRTGDIHKSGRPPEVATEFHPMAGELYRLSECTEYNSFLMNQTLFLFQEYCKNNNIDVLFFSYFDYLEPDSKIIDTSTVYTGSLTNALTGTEYTIPGIRQNQYFQGQLFHPNIDGHEKIANILVDFYGKRYSGN
jgi:hypothetical protein